MEGRSGNKNRHETGREMIAYKDCEKEGERKRR